MRPIFSSVKWSHILFSFGGLGGLSWLIYLFFEGLYVVPIVAPPPFEKTIFYSPIFFREFAQGMCGNYCAKCESVDECKNKVTSQILHLCETLPNVAGGCLGQLMGGVKGCDQLCSPPDFSSF